MEQPCGNSTKVPQKIKNRTTIGSSKSTPGYLSKENEKTICCLQVKDQWLQLYHTGLLFNVLQGRESANKTGNDPVGPLDVGPFSSLFCPLVERQNRTAGQQQLRDDSAHPTGGSSHLSPVEGKPWLMVCLYFISKMCSLGSSSHVTKGTMPYFKAWSSLHNLRT